MSRINARTLLAQAKLSFDYYINIYSPYNGEVICKRTKRQR